MKKQTLWIIGGGIVVGVVAVVLVHFGNPANMGFCIACFLRDIAGSMQLHSAPVVQYMRPEIIGLVMGAFGIALLSGSGSPRRFFPATRFLLGVIVMIGALMFLGCPLRMILRIAGGDLNAVVGLIGFIAGIGVGVLFLNRGFSLGRTYTQPKAEGLIMPAISLFFLILAVAVPSILVFSASGPGAQHAPFVIALAAGLIVGALAQRSRLCTMGGLRDIFLFKDFTLAAGFAGILVAAFIGNLLTGNFHLGFEGAAVAHTDALWNILGMFVVGWSSVFMGGCPLRQLILAGEGNSDSTITIMGMIVGAALCHNFGLASSGAGPTLAGQIAVGICIVLLGIIGIFSLKKTQ